MRVVFIYLFIYLWICYFFTSDYVKLCYHDTFAEQTLLVLRPGCTETFAGAMPDWSCQGQKSGEVSWGPRVPQLILKASCWAPTSIRVTDMQYLFTAVHPVVLVG